MITKSPRCSTPGCTDEPTLGMVGQDNTTFLCDRCRPDKKLDYQRDANWRHKIKTKHGIIIRRRDL